MIPTFVANTRLNQELKLEELSTLDHRTIRFVVEGNFEIARLVRYPK